MKSGRTIPPDEILAGATPAARRIMRRLRPVIRGAAPELVEVGYPGWRCVAYRHPKAGYLCGMFPLGDTVKLYFQQGARLADPAGILEGAGRQTRYLAFASLADVTLKAAMVSILVRDAIALKV